MKRTRPAKTGRQDRTSGEPRGGGASGLPRDAEAERQAILTAIPDMMFRLDRDGTYLEFIPAKGQKPYVPPAEFMGRTVSEILPPAPARGIMRCIKAALESGEAQSLEYQLTVDGRPHDYEARIAATGADEVLVIARDVSEGKVAAKALRESEQRYRALSDKSMVGVGVAVGGKLVYANDRFAEQIGYSVHEVLGKPIQDLIVPEDRDRASQRMRDLLQGAPEFSSQYRFLAKDGGVLPVEVSARPIQYGGDQALLAVVRDVTQRVEAEQALVGSERKWQSLVENASDIVFFVGPDMKIQYINRVVPFLEREDVIGTSMFDYISPEYHEVARKTAERVLRTGGVETYEVRGTGPYGQESWYSTRLGPVRVGGKVVAVAHIATDITERKKAQEALAEGEEKWHSLVESAHDIIFLVGRDMKIQYINHTVPGLEHGDVIGTSIFDYISPEYHDVARRATERVFQTGGVETYEISGTGPDGEEAWYSTRLGPVRLGEEVVAVAHIVTDNTERKRAEEALRENEGRLRSLVTNAPVILLAFDREGVVTAAEGRERIPGVLTPEEHIGRSVFELYRNVPAATEAARRALSGEPVTTIVELQRSSFEARVTPVRDGDGRVTGAVSVATDVTERVRAEEALRIQRDLAVAISGAADLDETLRLCLDASIRVSGMDCGALYLVDASSGALDLASHQGLSDAFVRSVAHYGPDHSNTRKIVAGEPAYTPFAELPVPKDEPKRQEALRTLAVIPIRHEGAVIACLNVASHTLDDLSIASRHAVETVAAQVGSAIARSRARDALRQSEARLRALVTNAPVILFAIDREGVFTAAEGTGMSILAIRPEDHVGRSIFELYDDMPGVIQAARRALSGEAFTVIGELQTSAFEAHVTPVRDRDGTITGAIAVATDVTERHRAEEAVKESEAKWRSLVENAPALILTLDRDGTVLFANRGVPGVPLEQALGSSIFDYAPPRYHDDMRQVFGRIFQVGGIGDFQVPWLGPSGDMSWHSVRVAPMMRGGEVVALTIMATEITERKRAEEALLVARDQLERKVERQMEKGDGYGMTFREFTVLHLVAAGKSDREIAATLGISTTTVQKHVSNILGKMQASSRTEAGVRAVQDGLLG